jgi:hypothetical protein
MVILLESIAFASLRTNQRYIIFVTGDKGSIEETFPVAEFEPRAAEQAVVVALAADLPSVLDQQLQAVPYEKPRRDKQEVAQQGGNSWIAHQEIGAQGEAKADGDQEKGGQEGSAVFLAVIGLALLEEGGEPLEDEGFLLRAAFGDRDQQDDGQGRLADMPAEPQAQFVEKVARYGAFVVAPYVEVGEDIVVGIERDAYVRTGLLRRIAGPAPSSARISRR